MKMTEFSVFGSNVVQVTLTNFNFQ